MMGVSRVAETFLSHHLAGNPGENCRSALYRAEKFDPRAKSSVYVSHIADFQTHFWQTFTNVTQFDWGVSSSRDPPLSQLSR